MIGGALCGLMAAVLQSLAYIASRHFIKSRASGAGVKLLILAHLWMGAMSMLVLLGSWAPHLLWRPVLVPMICAAGFSIVGQVGLMQAIKYAEPSRVSPLLTIKLLIPATLATLIGQPVGAAAFRSLTLWQWLAVLLCIVAGVSINRSGGKMRSRAVIAILYAAAFFAASDWSIGLIVAGFLKSPHMTILHASLLTEGCLFVLMGLIAGLCLPIAGPRRPGDWRDAFPYGLFWFAAMIVLFIAFGEVGVVLGTILQCTRGFMTILIGFGLMYLGFEHIEPRQSRAVVLRRLAAGVLMFLAISLYILRDPANFKWRSEGLNPASNIRTSK